MKKYLTFLLMLAVAMTMSACGNNEPEKIGENESSTYFGGKRVLIAYFSRGVVQPNAWHSRFKTLQGRICSA